MLILHSSRTHSGTIFPFILKEADRLSDAFNPGIHLQSTLTTRLLLPRRQSFVGRTPEASQTRGSWRTTPTRRRPPSAQPPCCFPHGDRQGRTCNPHFGLKALRDNFFSNSGRRRTRTSSRSSRGQTWGKQRDNPTGTRQANPSGQGKSEKSTSRRL